MSKLKQSEKQVREDIGKIAAELEVAQENEGMTRSELIAKAIDIYYSSSEVK